MIMMQELVGSPVSTFFQSRQSSATVTGWPSRRVN
jgi:hypothetical protein